MKKFVLAAIAVLSIGAGSAFAAQTVTNHLGQVIVTGAKVWVAPHFSLASIRRRGLFASCAAARHSFRAEPCRA